MVTCCARIKENKPLSEDKDSICDYSRCDQMPLTDQIIESAPEMPSELPPNKSTMVEDDNEVLLGDKG